MSTYVFIHMNMKTRFLHREELFTEKVLFVPILNTFLLLNLLFTLHV